MTKYFVCDQQSSIEFCFSEDVGQDSAQSVYRIAKNGRSGDRILLRARFSAPVHTGPGAHPASCTRGTGPFYGGKAAGAWG